MYYTDKCATWYSLVPNWVVGIRNAGKLHFNSIPKHVELQYELTTMSVSAYATYSISVGKILGVVGGPYRKLT